MHANLVSNDILEGLRLDHTLGNLTIYLSTTGSDAGDGSIGNPYATWDRALAQIPRCIDHIVRVKAAAGTYTSFPRQVRHFLGRKGVLSLEGAAAPTHVAGPFTVTTATKVGYDTGAGWDLEVAGAAWTPDQWYGKFVRFTSGDHEHRVHPVYAHTADVMSLAAPAYVAIQAGDTFNIVDPSVRIEASFAPTWALWGDGCPGRYIAQFAMANLEFVTDQSTVDPLRWFGYSYNANCNATFGLVRFIGLNAEIPVWSQRAGIINMFPFEEDVWPLLEDDTLIQIEPYMAAGSVQVLGSLAQPVTPGPWLEVVGADATERGCGISNCVCRSGVYVDSVKAELECCGFGFVDVDHQSKAMLFMSRVDAAGLNKVAVRCDDASIVDLWCTWVDSSDSDAVIVTDLSRALLAYLGGTTASITGYGVKIGRLSQANIESPATVDLEGTAGKVRFTQTDTTVNYPAAKSAETDGQGSWITA